MSKYQCSHCGERFAKTTEHMNHFIEKHDVGFVPRSQRISRRPSACWSCNADISPTETHCQCGALHPRLR